MSEWIERWNDTIAAKPERCGRTSSACRCARHHRQRRTISRMRRC